MIKSMTGFGKGESSGRFGKFTVEIRTVNHRYFDVSSRIPNNLGQFEDKIKKFVHKYIKRGKVSISLSHKRGRKEFDSIKLDENAVLKYYRLLNKIKNKFKLKDDVKLSYILSFPDVIIQEQFEYNPTSMWPTIERSLKEALVDCNKMRKEEGEVLYRDLIKRIQRIAKSIYSISKLSPILVSKYKSKLDSNIRDILKGRSFNIDKARLETELAIFAKQCDISEEITRVKSHLSALKNALASNEEAGRRIDFILQELQREVNTLGSKAPDETISRFVIDIKSEIEKMREQVQNIE